MTGSRARIGVFGGSFNPPHAGHRQLLVERLSRYDTLLVVPAADPPHKRGLAGFDHRVEMCHLAFDDLDFAAHAGVVIDTREASRPGPSYTVDTLRSVAAEHPLAQLTFFVGGDTDTTSWRDPDTCRSLARFVTVERSRYSSTEIRTQLARNCDARSLLAAGLASSVLDYIETHQLYQPTPNPELPSLEVMA